MESVEWQMYNKQERTILIKSVDTQILLRKRSC